MRLGEFARQRFGILEHGSYNDLDVWVLDMPKQVYLADPSNVFLGMMR